MNLGVRNVGKQEEIRWQSKKPSVGGLTFYITFLIALSFISIFSRKLDALNSSIELSLLVSCTVAFFIGLIDDARNTNPLLKLLGQIFCGIIVVYFGLIIPISPSPFWNSFITILWVVFLMNSINMLDNMDGMTTTISIFSIAGIVIFSSSRESIYLYHLSCMIGILFGFLYFNWKPSKIYMGDSGSQFLGMLLAHASIYFLWQQRIDSGGYFQINQFFLPLLFFTIPIFDTATVTIHRLIRKQSPFVGGRDHLSHHTVYLGLSDDKAVAILGLIHFVFILIGMYTFSNAKEKIYLILTLWIITFIIFQALYILARRRQALIEKSN